MKTSESSTGPPWQAIAKIVILIFLLLAANLAVDWVVGFLKFELRPSNEDVVHQTIIAAAFVYALLLAIPFVPGVEIGLLLITTIGQDIVPLVYLSTLAGLSASFFVGRTVSLTGLVRLLDRLRFSRASLLCQRIESMAGDERLKFLVSNSPSRILPVLVRYRYLALAVAINLPGNIVLGGGGGLALIAGVSRLFSAPGFLATIAIAVSPVPLAVYFLGTDILTR